MINSRVVPGINVQWPWSQLLLSGQKTVETRSYPIPQAYNGVELALIETPGLEGRKCSPRIKTQIVGLITFRTCFEYTSLTDWLLDSDRHRVPSNDPKFAFVRGKPKWGWEVQNVFKFKNPLPPPSRRGIIFATECVVF